MREPEHAAAIVAAMARAVTIPVTVKMRAGWNDEERNAPIARDGWSKTPARGRSRSTGEPRRRVTAGSPIGIWSAQVAELLTIPVFGSGDCVTPEQIVARLKSGVEGVLVGRGVLRNPWILAQASDLMAGRPMREVSLAERGQFLLDYIELLMNERVREPEGFRSVAPGAAAPGTRVTTAGSSTRSGRWGRGTRRVSTTDPNCGTR